METRGHNTCVVCKETSDQVGLHYTRMLCNGCRAFFKRTVQGKVKVSGCKSDGQCVVDPSTRKLCKACRFEACKRAGVDSTKVQQPKDGSPETSTMGQQFAHGININNGHFVPSASSGIQSAFQPYYLTAQGSQNICAMPPTIDFHSPLGMGLLKQNLTANFGSHQVTSPHAFDNSKLPVHCSSTASNNSPMQMWASALNGGFIPGGYSSMESNNRFTSAASVNIPYGNTLDTASSSTSASYADMANIGSRLFYNSNAAAASQYGALYTDLLRQSASALGNHASFSDARYLSSSLIDRHRMNMLDFPVPVSLHDSGVTPHADSYSLSNIRQGMITSLMGTAPFSAAAQIKDSKHGIVDIYQRDTCSAQTTNRDIKEEPNCSCNSSECCCDCKDSNDTPALSTVGRHAQADNDRQDSAAGHKHKHPSMDSNCLNAVSSKKDTTSVHSSGKSSAFMIDMLLKPEDQEMWSQEDERVTIATGLYRTPSLSLSNWQDDKHTDETTNYPCDSSGFKEITCKKADSEEPHAHTFNQRELLGSSTPNNLESERSLDDTLSDVNVYDTDEDTEVNELKSNHESTAQACYRGNSNSGSVRDTSKGENKELMKNKGSDDSESIVKNSPSHQTSSSLGLSQSHGVSNGDSGLGRSSHVSASYDLQQTRPGSVEHAKADVTGEAHYINKENAQVIPSRKRSISLSEENNTYSAKKIKLNSHSFTETSGSINYLRDIPQNYGNGVDNNSTSPGKLSGSVATITDSSTEYEAKTKDVDLLPQFTSTPIVHERINKCRFFLKVICDFAKYCQLDDVSTPEDDVCTGDEHSPIRSSPSKDPSPPADSSPDSFNEHFWSESQSNKLERLEKFQEILMRKIRSSGSYTMPEFKADALKLSSLAEDVLRCEQLTF